MQDENKMEGKFLAIHMTTSGRRGAVNSDEKCEKFVRYNEISIPTHQVKYLVYQYYETGVYGHAACSLFYENNVFERAFNTLKCIPSDCPLEEIDTRMYRAMRECGSVQKIDVEGKRYDLKEKLVRVGIFPEFKVLSIPTENNPLDNSHLVRAASSCVLS